MSRSSLFKLAAWLLFGLSLAVLVPRLSRLKEPPLAESRRLPARPKTEGAWWHTGKPAPAAAQPDLTGVWFGNPLPDVSKAALPGQEMVLTPEGKRRYATVDHAKNPSSLCLPPGPVRIMFLLLPVMIVQRPDVVLFLAEYQRTYRIIYADGRGHDPEGKDYPEWMGSSVGHWEQDTFVIDTVHILDRSWLDSSGHEHSGQLHTTERLRLADPNTLEHLTTLDDPVFFVKPFTFRRLMKRQIGDRILDNTCVENEKDRQNLLPTIGAAGR